MEKIKIEISATPRQFEVVNYLIKQAINSLDGVKNKEKLKAFSLTSNDLKKAEDFRHLLVTAFIENSNP